MKDAIPTMGKIENERVFSHTHPSSSFGQLWNLDDMRALNSKERGALVKEGVLPAADNLLAQLQEIENKKIIAANDQPKPTVTATQLISISDKLAQDPHRWESKTTGKCNLFVDAVFRAGFVPLPWDSAHIPDSHGMRLALDKASETPGSGWKKIYTYDTAHGLQSDEAFTHYQPKNGDFIIWDKAWGDKWVQHSGIAVEPYDIKYAGARDQPGKPPKHGVGTTNIYNFTGNEPYGAPTAIYRYTGLK